MPVSVFQLIFHVICQFQFLDPPQKQTLTIFWGVKKISLDPPKTDTNNFLGGIRKFFGPPHEKLLVDISYKIPVDWNWYIV